MKIINLLLATSLFFTACNYKPGDKKDDKKEDTAKIPEIKDTSKTPMPGSDRDEHGCIGSAGYTWSVVRNECIRIFEAGIALEATAEVEDKTTGAFAVFSSDSSRAELFIPREGSSIILESARPGTWTKDKWLLEKKENFFDLKKSGTMIYREHPDK